MLSYLRSTQNKPELKQTDKLQPGSWIRAERPSNDEKQQLRDLGIDHDILHDALDPHEIPRVDLEDGWTYFITRLPDTDDDFNDFTTPILFALGEQYLVTVSRDSLGRMWQPFIDNTKVPTTQKTKLFMMMVESILRQYETRISSINRQMRARTSDVHSMKSKDIAHMTEYERKLNDFLDALQPTNTALERLLSGKVLPLYDDDLELVEDLSIDFEQLISRCRSLLRTITNFRNSYRAVMDTRLNETIRLLTVITLVFTVPTTLSAMFSMNVPIPLQAKHYMFWAVTAARIIIDLIIVFYFLRRRR